MATQSPPNATFTIAPELIELADTWPMYQDPRDQRCSVCNTLSWNGRFTDANREHHAHADVTAFTLYQDPRDQRCTDCRQLVWEGQSTGGRVAHLVHAHGYRMDGRRFNDKNQEIGHAGR